MPPRRKERQTQSAPAAEAALPSATPGAGRADAAALLLLVLLHLAFFWRAALLLGFFAHSDICYFFEPAKALMHEALRAGRLPLWSPYIFCGYPVAAEGQIAAFYPPGLLISWLLPSPAAINWLVISHLTLASVGMYLLARGIGLTRVSAWLAAAVFSFSGYLFAHIHHVSLVCAAGWLPWVLLFVERAWRGRLLPNSVGAALAWGACTLCGHPQTLFHISLMVLFWIAWQTVASRRQSRAPGKSTSGGPHSQSPSPRAERGQSTGGETNPATRGVRSVTRAVLLAGLVFVIGAALASVQLLMTSDLSRTAPHGERGSLDYVTSFSLLPTHLLGLLAPNWQGTPADNTYRGEKYYWEYVLYIGLAPLALAIVGAARRRNRVWLGLALVSLVLALGQGNPLYHLLRFVPGFSDFRVPARFIFTFTFAAAILAGSGLEALLSWRPLLRPRRAAAAAAVLIALSLADLITFDRTLAPLAGPEVFTATPRIVQALKSDQTWGRSLIVTLIQFYADWSPPGGWAQNPDGWLDARVYLPADVPQSFDIPIVNGYAGFVDPQHSRFFDEATGRAQAGDYSLYSLVGTRHFVMPPGVPLRGLPGVEVPPFRVYLNEGARGRAFLALAYDGTDWSHGVIRSAAGAIISIDESRPEHITVHAHSDADAVVVVNERWDPGWHARVDDKPAPLREIDGVLMAAQVSAGEHTVEFLYRPRGLIIGRAISLASLAVCLLLLAASLRGRRSGD